MRPRQMCTVQLYSASVPRYLGGRSSNGCGSRLFQTDSGYLCSTGCSDRCSAEATKVQSSLEFAKLVDG